MHYTYAILILALVTYRSVNSQPTSLPQRDQWPVLASDSTSKYFYPTLLSRFLQCDTTMSESDVALLYFGYTLQPLYRPYLQTFTEDTLRKSNQNHEYEATLSVGLRYLAENPVSLSGNIQVMLAYQYLADSQAAARYSMRTRQLVQAILCTGTGESPDSAFVVICIRDEYTILDIAGYAIKKQAAFSGKGGRHYDVLTAVSRQDKSVSKDFCFDITSQYNSLSKEFNFK